MTSKTRKQMVTHKNLSW